MKILIDMNLPPLLAVMLSDMGLKSMHWSKVGAHDAKDSEILQYAIENELVVMTCDLDFSTILSITHGSKPSIIQIRTQCFHIEKLAVMLKHSIPLYKDDLASGAILTIDAKRARLRLLPL